MAVFIASLRVFTRGPDHPKGTPLLLPDASPTRLVLAVLAGAIVAGCLSFVWSNTVLPSANHRLRVRLIELRQPGTFSSPDDRGDRELSVAELRQLVRSAEESAHLAARNGQARQERAARQQAATYAVEIEKKYAIGALCVILAVLGAALGLRIGRASWPVVAALSAAVFSVVYVGLIGGEELGDRVIVSPFVAMWAVNLVLATAAMPLLWSIDKSVGRTT